MNKPKDKVVTLKSKTYICIIKSHTEAPDFESEVEAESMEEAVDYFYNQINHYGGDWGRDDVAQYVSEMP